MSEDCLDLNELEHREHLAARAAYRRMLKRIAKEKGVPIPPNMDMRRQDNDIQK